ncbi:MAG: hypothetical protein AAGA54_18800 [Myxococcota bacterium]
MVLVLVDPAAVLDVELVVLVLVPVPTPTGDEAGAEPHAPASITNTQTHPRKH